MAAAVQDFFSVRPQADFYLDAENEPQTVEDLYDSLFTELTPEAFAAEASAAVELESTEYVEDLLYCAFATPMQLCAFMEKTIAGFSGQPRNERMTEYAERFQDCVRVALERTHPALYAAFVAGDVSSDAREIIGVVLKRCLRPSHAAFRAARKNTPRKKKLVIASFF